MYDYDPQNDLDSPAFLRFTAEVYEAITDRVTIGDVRRRMGERFRDRWICSALSSLVAIGKLRECWGALPTRWERNERGPMDGKGVLPGPAKPASKTMVIYPEAARKVTA